MTSTLLSLPTSATGGRSVPTPVWWPISGPAAQLSPLSPFQCLRLLDRAGTGQLSFTCVAGTATLDVEYEIARATAVLGPVPDRAVGLMGSSQLILFQVDHADLAAQWGWSVVLVDEARPATYLEVGLSSLAGRRISSPRA